MILHRIVIDKEFCVFIFGMESKCCLNGHSICKAIEEVEMVQNQVKSQWVIRFYLSESELRNFLVQLLNANRFFLKQVLNIASVEL